MLTWPCQKSEKFKYVPLHLLKSIEEKKTSADLDACSGSLPLHPSQVTLSANPFTEVSTHHCRQTLSGGTHIIDIQMPSSTLVHPYYELSVEKGAEALLVLLFDKNPDSSWLNLTLTLLLEQNAQLTVVSNVDLNTQSFVTLFASCQLAKCSKLYWNHALVNGYFSHFCLDLTVKEQAHACVKSCLMAQEGFHGFIPSVTHQEPSSSCSLKTRGLAGGDSTLVQHGTIFVPENSSAIEAHYSSDNLLLSQKAKVYARPDLDIHCDDVICSHGVTLGHLDPRQVFYLQSRFLDEERAKLLLVKAFVYQLLSDFPPLVSLPKIMEKFYDKVNLRLAQLLKSL